MKYTTTLRLPLILIGCALAAGCATSGPQVADNQPKRCHAGQILSCSVKGHGATKTYSNCRCEYVREINTGFGSFD